MNRKRKLKMIDTEIYKWLDGQNGVTDDLRRELKTFAETATRRGAASVFDFHSQIRAPFHANEWFVVATLDESGEAATFTYVSWRSGVPESVVHHSSDWRSAIERAAARGDCTIDDKIYQFVDERAGEATAASEQLRRFARYAVERGASDFEQIHHQTIANFPNGWMAIAECHLEALIRMKFASWKKPDMATHAYQDDWRSAIDRAAAGGDCVIDDDTAQLLGEVQFIRDQFHDFVAYAKERGAVRISGDRELFAHFPNGWDAHAVLVHPKNGRVFFRYSSWNSTGGNNSTIKNDLRAAIDRAAAGGVE